MRNYNEKLRWEKASNIKRIFMHHPDSSRVVRYIAFFFFPLCCWPLDIFRSSLSVYG